MRNISILLSLITIDNDFQREQAAAGEETARRLGVDLETIFAENDSINQSQQLLNAIQSRDRRPDAIAFEPISLTGLEQVAKAAVRAGVGWAVLNRNVDYISALRSSARVPVFQVGADHVEVGRIQGRQLRALLPDGGMALYLQGPASASAAEDRALGMSETKPNNIELRAMRANWTQEGAYAAVSSWLRLSTSHSLPIKAIVAQNDVMALGARKCFETETSGEERDRWLGLPFLGCDGLARTGQAWVRDRLLKATVIIPRCAGVAIENLVTVLRSGGQPQEKTLILPESFPPLERLGATMTHAASVM